MGRRKGPALTRQHVVSAALSIVKAEGPEALGVSRVARELGIRPPSLYNHVGSGEELARATVLEATRHLLGALQAAVEPAAEPREQLMMLAYAMRQWVLENRGWYALMGRVVPQNEHPESGPVAANILALFGQPLEQLGVPTESRIHALRGLRSAMHGFLMLEASDQFQLPEDRAASYRWMIEALIRGLQSPA